ncbi:uncharacterized protein LOC134818537 [Bolinopsis microptera]|uniref:uncharacterized protein LOC134818537 n=1 Tax=Bolinopsis microptera TaxID=2820187 RepID=UPI0030799783
MNRDSRSWQPSLSTRVCTDHFFLDDFQEGDLERYHARANPETRTLIRLKVDSVPNTDRRTGSFANPLVQTMSKRPPPKERLVEMQPAGSTDGIDIEQDTTNESCSNIEPDSFWEIDELYFSETDSEDSQPTDEVDDDDFDTGLHNEDINSSFSEEGDFIELDDLELDDLTDDDEPVIDESVESFTTNACWAIISVPLLLSLFKFCPECGARSVIKRINCAGFGIVVNYRCYGILPHEGVWRSSRLRQKKYECNLVVSAAAFLCGMSYSVLESFMTCLSVPYITCSSFYKNNTTNLYPIIVDQWTSMRTALLESRSQLEHVDIAGDGHFDSPGWCAKFCTYSILDIKTGAILDFFVAQKGMYRGDLETFACKEVLLNLVSQGLKVRHFVTDENTRIAKLMRTFFTSITHNYDIWHKARLVKRKLMEMSKKLPKLSEFVAPIVNHFWYSCKKCAGDPKELVERVHSTLLHISNHHAWTADPFEPLKLQLQKERNEKRKKQIVLTSEKLYPYFHKVKHCDHSSRVKHRTLQGLKWFKIESEEFTSLFKYFTSTRFISSIQLCCNFLHTGALEVYHNVRLKLLPKRTSYSLNRMVVGSMVIAIEINKNLTSNRKEFWSYSKSQKKYVSKSRVINKDYSYRKDILQGMWDYVGEGKEPRSIATMLKESQYVKRTIPKNITGLKIPKKSTLLDRSRF